MAQINLQPAYEKAKKELAGISPEAASDNAQVAFDPVGFFFTVPFLGTKYHVYYPSGEVRCAGEKKEVPLAYQIILLHYLTHCSPRAVEGRKIAFRELPGGSIYVGPFTKRSINPLVAIFGSKPGKLAEAAGKLGGWTEKMGDLAVTVPVLPKIPITFVLWEGDDEFPPSGNVLFDASAPSHLDTEDYALLPGLTIWEMKKLVQI
mgnify:CR=1 FL=1